MEPEKIESSGRCYGYIFIGITTKNIDGSVIEEQERKIREWAEQQDKKLIMIYKDVGSSSVFVFERTQFKKLMEAIGKGDVLITGDISRVSRNPLDMTHLVEQLGRKGANAFFLKEGFDTSGIINTLVLPEENGLPPKPPRKGRGPQKKPLKSEMKIIATKEPTMTSGRPPYGWAKVNKEISTGLVEVPEQQAVIASIKKMHDEEKMPFQSIAKKLTSDKVPTPNGKQTWNDKTVKNIYDRGEVITKGKYMVTLPVGTK